MRKFPLLIFKQVLFKKKKNPAINEVSETWIYLSSRHTVATANEQTKLKSYFVKVSTLVLPIC